MDYDSVILEAELLRIDNKKLQHKCEQQAKEIEELKRIKDDFFAENTRYARGWKKADDKIAKQAAVLREARALLSVLLILLDLEHVAAPENTNDLLARIDSVLGEASSTIPIQIDDSIPPGIVEIRGKNQTIRITGIKTEEDGK